MSEIHHAGPSGWDTGPHPRMFPSDPPYRETEEERRWREHGNAHLQLVSRREFLEYTRKDRRHEKVLIVVGAIFDLMVVILALKEFL